MDESYKYLHDILSAIEEIEIFVSQRPRQFSVFLDDLMFRRAIERNIEIIGEAMNRVLKQNPDLPISNSRKIVNTRNYVIHAYDSLSPELLWGIVINSLPLLKEEIISILKPPKS